MKLKNIKNYKFKLMGGGTACSTERTEEKSSKDENTKNPEKIE